MNKNTVKPKFAQLKSSTFLQAKWLADLKTSLHGIQSNYFHFDIRWVMLIFRKKRISLYDLIWRPLKIIMMTQKIREITSRYKEAIMAIRKVANTHEMNPNNKEVLITIPCVLLSHTPVIKDSVWNLMILEIRILSVKPIMLTRTISRNSHKICRSQFLLSLIRTSLKKKIYRFHHRLSENIS